MEYKKIRPKKRKFKGNRILYLFLLFLFIGVGYAALTTSLSIYGTTNVATNSWNIHFANLHVQGGSVEANAPTVSSNSISYAATLAQPGDYYEFSVDVKNEGTLPGKVSLVNLTGNGTNYLYTSYTYSNDENITVGDILNAGKSRRITIKAWIPSDIDTSLLPTEDTPITLSFNLQYIQSEVDAPLDATDQIIALAKTNSCITKYEGEVTDKVGITEQANKVYFNKCADKRNIIFNNMCWQMIRTTETGGIKMIYNGEVSNGKCLSTRGDHTGIIQSTYGEQNMNSEILYGDSFTYNEITEEFTLTNTMRATWSDSTYESLLGKYTCMSLNNICGAIHQVNGYSSSTTAHIATYTIGSAQYNEIGTSSFNANNYSPGMAGYMFNQSYNSKYRTVYSTFKFAQSFTYSANTNNYTLSGTTINISSPNGTDISNTHYTCWNDTGVCDTISYVYYTSSNYVYYINLIKGKSIDDALNEMTNSKDMNKNNSSIKGIIDAWYRQSLSSKTHKLEKAIFCNNRTIINKGGWNSEGGSTSSTLQFKNYNSTTSLECENETDQFAVGNSSADLDYPVGLLQSEEVENINDTSSLSTNKWYWLMTPVYFDDSMIYTKFIQPNGTNQNGTTYYIRGVRPVISLAQENIIASGTGSENDPFIIQEN